MHVKGANAERRFLLLPQSGESIMAPAVFTIRPLVTKLLNYGPLSADEEQALDQASSSIREIEAGEDIVLEGSSPDHSTLLLSGLLRATTSCAMVSARSPRFM